MTREERDALFEVLIWVISATYPLSGQMPDYIQKDMAILQGVKVDE